MAILTDTPAWADIAFEGVPGALPTCGPVSIRIGVLEFACRLWLGRPGDRLLVHLHGAIRKGEAAPTLEAPMHPPGFHLLTISDPSLLLDPTLRRGVFLGPRAQHPIEGAVEIVSVVARQLGLAPDQTLFYGASGSGSAGCMAALKLGARCVAVNAQLDLYQARKMSHAIAMLKMFDPDFHFLKVLRKYPDRLRVKSAYAAAVKAGRSPRLMIYQNRRDALHLEGFYRPFCEALGLDPAGDVSRNGCVQVRLVDYPGGHKVRPDKGEALIARAMTFLYPEEAVGEVENDVREAA